MDAFVFRRGGTTYYLVRAIDVLLLHDLASLQPVPGAQAARILETFSRSSEHASALLGDYLLAATPGVGSSSDLAARRARLAQTELELRKGNAGAWTMFSRARAELGVLLKIADEVTPSNAPDKTFGSIEFTLTDQNDVPIARTPWALKRGDERVRGGTLNAQGNAYVDGIEPGTYKIVLGSTAVEEPPEPADWISFELLDDFGLPVGGEPFEVTDSAGKKHTGVIDAGGRGMIAGVAPGTCELTFTRLDAQAWGPAGTYEAPPPITGGGPPEPAPIPAPKPREFDDGSGARKDRAVAIGAANFQFDSAFPGPDTFGALEAMHAASAAAPAARLCVFGHADQQGSDDYNKRLSDRRARAVLALLTQDLVAFDALSKQDEWRLIHYQSMLSGLGISPIMVDDIDGPQTRAATKQFQKEYNKNTYHPEPARPPAYPALVEDGVLGELTKSALRDAYLAKAKQTIEPGRFAGPKFAGCGEFNPLSYDAQKSRRVSLAVFEGAIPADGDFPCKEGDATKCPLDLSAQKAFDPKQRVPPRLRCPFYRKHIDESAEHQPG